MARSKPSKQLSQAEIECFSGGGGSAAQEHRQPVISPHCDHYRATRVLLEVLLNTVREVTGKEVAFIQWNGTGPSKALPLGNLWPA
ncbi:hypothetical protein NKH97_29965 [Mesorhizobium sp. M0870]